MPETFPLLEIVQALDPGTPPPLTLRIMGKSLVSISVLALVTFGVAARAVWIASRGEPAARARARATMDGSLFWGAFTFAVGVFHMLMGLMMTALSVRAAGTLTPDAHWLVATGIAVPIAACTYGLFVFLVAALIWFGFRSWHARAAA